MSLAFFDFDGTLTRRDTILPFAFFIARTRPGRRWRVAHLMFWLLLLKVRLISNHRFKAQFCSLLLQGEARKQMDDLALAFATHHVEKALNAPVVAALRNHQQEGDEVYLVSSNFSFLLRPLQAAWALRGIVATEVEIEGGRCTGRIAGQVCDGAEKLSRVLALFNAERVREATAYGDSRGDRALLAFVKRAVWT